MSANPFDNDSRPFPEALKAAMVRVHERPGNSRRWDDLLTEVLADPNASAMALTRYMAFWDASLADQVAACGPSGALVASMVNGVRMAAEMGEEDSDALAAESWASVADDGVRTDALAILYTATLLSLGVRQSAVSRHSF